MSIPDWWQQQFSVMVVQQELSWSAMLIICDILPVFSNFLNVIGCRVENQGSQTHDIYARTKHGWHLPAVEDEYEWRSSSAKRLRRIAIGRGVNEVEHMLPVSKQQHLKHVPQQWKILFAGAALSTAALIQPVGQLKNLMHVKGKQVEHKEVHR